MDTLFLILVPILLFGGFGTLIYFKFYAPDVDAPKKNAPSKGGGGYVDGVEEAPNDDNKITQNLK